MRLALVGAVAARGAQRSRRAATPRGATPLGISLLQVAWVSRCSAAVGLRLPAFVVLVVVELLVPVWAERAAPTTLAPAPHRRALRPVHAHRARRIDPRPRRRRPVGARGRRALSALVPLIVGGLLIVFSMWWVYFDRPAHDLLTLPDGLRLGLRPLFRLRRPRPLAPGSP